MNTLESAMTLPARTILAPIHTWGPRTLRLRMQEYLDPQWAWRREKSRGWLSIGRTESTCSVVRKAHTNLRFARIGWRHLFQQQPIARFIAWPAWSIECWSVVTVVTRKVKLTKSGSDRCYRKYSSLRTRGWNAERRCSHSPSRNCTSTPAQNFRPRWC